ncbi:MAG: hypothetical protein AAGH92_08625 [Planctomycetota bacterium]
MASITFPHAEQAGFTAIPNIRYGVLAYQRNNQWVQTTGATSGGTPDAFHRFCKGLPVQDVRARGTIEVSGTCAKSQIGYANPATMAIKPQRFSLRKVWPLLDVTGSNGTTPDTEKHWDWRIPRLLGNVASLVKSTGPLVDSDSQTLSLLIDLMGTFTGTAITRNVNTSVPLTHGGPMPVSFDFEYSGGYAMTPVSTNFTSTMEDTVTDPVKLTTTLDLDDGETITNSALLYDLQISNDNENGGSVYIDIGLRFDAAA